MRTGQWKTMGIGSLIGKMIYAVFGLAASMLCIMGYYPVVPAFYTACCLDKKRNFLLYIGLVVGMGWCMPVAAIVKYLFILFVLGIAIRFYIWANRRCSGWTAGMIAGITTIAMNTSGLLILNMEKKALILGISEGVIVFALAVLFHYGIGMGSHIGENPLPKEFISKDQFYFDACYNPAKTQFLLDAEEAGATILNGLGMSLYQGAAQIEYWTGQEPPIEAMRQKLLDIIAEK